LAENNIIIRDVTDKSPADGSTQNNKIIANTTKGERGQIKTLG